MDAIVQEGFGPAGVLVAREVDDPVPGPGQVRVRVAAAGVHLGPTGAGGYAELAVTAVDTLHRLPDHVSEADAVAVLGTGRMATGLLELARPRPGELALVTSSAGGIGTLLVQALTARGVDVVAAAGSAGRAGRARGATPADYSAPDWDARLASELGDRRPTLVFDGVGGAVGRAAFDLLAPGGRTVLYGWSSGSATSFTSQELYATGRSAIVALGPPILALGLRRLAQEALDLLAAGTFAPVTSRFPLADAAGAHRALEERRTEGKVVLVP